MKKLTILFLGLAALLTADFAKADIVVNLTSPTGRGDRLQTDPVLADFVAFGGTELDAATTVFNADPDDLGGGNGGAWNYFDTTRTIGGIDILTTGGGNGFSAGADSWTNGNTVLDGYTFGVVGQTVTFDGIAAQAAAGDTIVVSAWGLGDNLNQNSSFTATYSGTSLSGATAFGSDRATETDAVPLVNFSFVADGTDQLVLSVDTSGHFNAFSVAFVPSAIPEPTAIALLGLGSLAMFVRRRRA